MLRHNNLAHTLYDEDFVVVARARHPFAARPTLERFCQAQHLVVSMTGDPHGFVGARRVALTVPDFAMGLATVAESDLIAAMPRRFVAMHAARFAVVSREAPLRLRAFSIRAAVPKVALMDAGLAWLFGVLREAVEGERGARDKRRAKVRAAR